MNESRGKDSTAATPVSAAPVAHQGVRVIEHRQLPDVAPPCQQSALKERTPPKRPSGIRLRAPTRGAPNGAHATSLLKGLFDTGTPPPVEQATRAAGQARTVQRRPSHPVDDTVSVSLLATPPPPAGSLLFRGALFRDPVTRDPSARDPMASDPLTRGESSPPPAAPPSESQTAYLRIPEFHPSAEPLPSDAAEGWYEPPEVNAFSRLPPPPRPRTPRAWLTLFALGLLVTALTVAARWL